MKAINIEWDIDEDIVDGSLPREVELPKDIQEDEIADYLSDEYGFCVFEFDIEKEETKDWLNIVVVNCDDKYIEYEWDSIKDFISDMNSNNENIPMLDDILVEVNTKNNELQSWWENDALIVDELLEKCKNMQYIMLSTYLSNNLYEPTKEN